MGVIRVMEAEGCGRRGNTFEARGRCILPHRTGRRDVCRLTPELRNCSDAGGDTLDSAASSPVTARTRRLKCDTRCYDA